MSRSGGFEEDGGGFDDLLVSTNQYSPYHSSPTLTPTATITTTADDSLNDNPFADMESSQFIPASTSPFGFNSPPRFVRENAPEPETPTYRDDYHPDSSFAASCSYSPPAFSTSPVERASSETTKRIQDPSDLSSLLGDPTPILPTFRSTFKPPFHPVTKDNHLPVSSIGTKSLEGPLAALLGLNDREDAQSSTRSAVVAAAPDKSGALKEPTKTIPTPLSTVDSSRAPSLTASGKSEQSNLTTDSYAKMVSPMTASPASVGANETDGRKDSGENGLEATLTALRIESTEVIEEVEKTMEGVESVTSTEPIPTITTDLSSSLTTPPVQSLNPTLSAPQSPFTSVAVLSETIPALTTTTPSRSIFNDDDQVIPSPSRGFRSFNDDTFMETASAPQRHDYPGEDVFASVYHQEPIHTEPQQPFGFNEVSSDQSTVDTVERTTDQTNGQPLPPLPPLPTVSPENVDHTSSLSPTFVIAVGDPQKVGSSLNVAAQHTVYTVRTKTTSSAYRKPEFSVLRRFSHFLWLFDALTLNNPGVIVPGMPEKNALGRFGSGFVENRRSALQAALMKIVAHPMLVGDPDLRLFLESDSFSNDIKQRKVDTVVEGKGFFTSLSSSISGSSKFHEVDEYFDSRRQTLEAFETQLKLLLLSLAASAKVRIGLQSSMAELQSAFIALSTCDLSGALRTVLEKAAGLQKRLRELSEEQSRSEEEIGGLTSTAEGYARLCGSVKLVFSARAKAYTQWQLAESHLRKMRAAHEKAKKANKVHAELLGLSLAEISDAERKASDGQHDFDDVGKLVKAEMARFDKEKVDDFKKAVEDYADGMVLRQREVVLAWTKYQEILIEAAGTNVAEPRSPVEVESAS